MNLSDKALMAIDLAKIGFYRYFFDGTIAEIDQVSFDFFELKNKFKDPSSVIGKNISDILVYIYKKGRLRAELQKRGKVSRLEYGFMTIEGNEKWGVHNSFINVDEETGKESIQVSFYDITDLKLAQREAQQQKEKLLVTLKSIGDGVISVDIDGAIVLMNRVAEKLTGWSQEEAEGRQLEEVFKIINGKTRKKTENPVNRIFREKRTMFIPEHTVLINRDGSERMIADSGAPIRDKNGEIMGAALVFRDVTEKFQLEERLRLRDKIESLSVLAGGIAHDFNNICSIIIGNASIGLTMTEPNSELYPLLTDIENGGRSAQRLTTQLLAFSKGGAPVKIPSNINKIIDESAKFILRGTPSKFKYDLAGELWACDVDRGQFSQVMCNLVINASQAMPNGGTIRARTRNLVIGQDDSPFLSPGKYVEITLEDQGPGISDEQLTKIFDPFYTTKEEGSGLGLATSYSIIRNHNGYIDVSSEAEQGAVFKIYLPALDISTADIEEQENNRELRHSGKGRVLVMDDQEMVLSMVGRLLQKMGYEAVLTDEGFKAVEAYRKSFEAGNPFDIVILDLTVPGGMGGKAALVELQKINPEVKAIVSSGYSSDPIMGNHKEAGFCGVIPKPYSIQELSEVFSKVMK